MVGGGGCFTLNATPWMTGCHGEPVCTNERSGLLVQYLGLQCNHASLGLCNFHITQMSIIQVIVSMLE